MELVIDPKLNQATVYFKDGNKKLFSAILSLPIEIDEVENEHNENKIAEVTHMWKGLCEREGLVVKGDAEYIMLVTAFLQAEERRLLSPCGLKFSKPGSETLSFSKVEATSRRHLAYKRQNIEETSRRSSCFEVSRMM